VDETGQPNGAVPTNTNGTGDRGDATRHGGWGPPPPLSLAPPHNGSDSNGVRKEPAWSSAGAALEPTSDPLSAAWPGASGFGHPGYQDVGTPVAVGAARALASDPARPPAGPSGVPTTAATGRATPVVPPVSNGPPRVPAQATTYPASAPPYPYEGDLEAAEPTPYESWNTRPNAPLPPGHVGFGEATPPRGYPTVTQARPVPADVPPGEGTAELPEPPAPSLDRAEILPQRVPAEPDVPALPEPVTDEAGSPAEAAELARIAARLKHGVPPAPPTRESFDVDAVLAAVREVPGVRDAHLRHNRDGSGVHTLRLDLADGADGGQVSRLVARLLGEKMGLSAALGAPAAPASAEAARTYRATAKAAPAPDTAYQARRRHPGTGTRGRAAVEPRLPADDHGLTLADPPAAQVPTPGPLNPAVFGEPVSRPLPPRIDGLRVVLDHVQVSTFGLDARVEVRLGLGERRTIGEASGPAVDGYVLRLCAVSTATAIDQLLLDESSGASRARCFVEHAAVVPFGSCQVAVAVVLLVCNGWVEQLAGSALVAGDPRQSVVRATLAAVNRRLESLLP